jgi:hypothetical protein
MAGIGQAGETYGKVKKMVFTFTIPFSRPSNAVEIGP